MVTCNSCDFEDDELDVRTCIDCPKDVCDACGCDGPDGTVCEDCADKRNAKALGE